MNTVSVYTMSEEYIDKVHEEWLRLMTEGPETRKCAEEYMRLGESYIVDKGEEKEENKEIEVKLSV